MIGTYTVSPIITKEWFRCIPRTEVVTGEPVWGVGETALGEAAKRWDWLEAIDVNPLNDISVLGKSSYTWSETDQIYGNNDQRSISQARA
jgi:hypothetical protein